MACSECKKIREEDKKYYDETDKIAKTVFIGLIIVGGLAVYGLVSLIRYVLWLITNTLLYFFVIEREKN